MRVAGYRLKGYDAMYEKTWFDVRGRSDDKSCVLEISEDLSGTTYIVEIDKDSKLFKMLTSGNKKYSRKRG